MNMLGLLGGGMMDEDPRRQGLLSAALAGLAASGPSTKPVSFGQTLGQAGMQGMQSMRDAEQFGMARDMKNLQMEQMRFQQQKMQEDMARQAQQRQFDDQYAATLTPEQQAEFRADRQGFLQRSKPIALGRSLFNPRTGKIEAVDPTLAEERAAKFEERLQLMDREHKQQIFLAQQNNASREQIAALMRQHQKDMLDLRNANNAANSGSKGQDKPPLGFRWTPEGDLERIKGGPADLKAAAELEKKASGAGDVEVALGTLRDAYSRLEAGGGITSTDSPALGNVIPSLSSSAPGQAVGKLFGTKNQSARNDIAMARPALLAALMKATGMSAKQMDSNAELKLWLATATDPTLDVQSNRKALDNIERKYLSGANVTPSPSADKPAAKQVVRRGKYQGKNVVEYSDGTVEFEK